MHLQGFRRIRGKVISVRSFMSLGREQAGAGREPRPESGRVLQPTAQHWARAAGRDTIPRSESSFCVLREERLGPRRPGREWFRQLREGPRPWQGGWSEAEASRESQPNPVAVPFTDLGTQDRSSAPLGGR